MITPLLFTGPGFILGFIAYSNCSALIHVLFVIMASGKWERVGKKGKPFNKHRGEQNNTKDSDKPLDGSQFQLTGMFVTCRNELFIICIDYCLYKYSCIKLCQ